jgi:alkylation response protein AidB-like acyl-CoA dehydrogenase
VTAVLAGIESGHPYDQEPVAHAAGEMGLAGMALPERFGRRRREPARGGVVLEELGAAVAPVPFLSSAVVATRRC